MAIDIIQMTATGNETVTSDRPVSGRVVAIHLDHTNSDATCDSSVATKGNTGCPAQTLLSLTDVNADTWYYPQAQIQTTAGVAVAGAYTPFRVDDYLTLTTAQNGATDTVKATVLVECGGMP